MRKETNSLKNQTTVQGIDQGARENMMKDCKQLHPAHWKETLMNNSYNCISKKCVFKFFCNSLLFSYLHMESIPIKWSVDVECMKTGLRKCFLFQL